MLKVNPAICAENMKLWKKGASFMIRIGKKEKSDKLYQAILQLKDPQECYDFFQDLCTVSELRSMEQRFEVASLLNDGMIYSDILEQTGASSATISRVNRSLNYGNDGYDMVFARIAAKQAADNGQTEDQEETQSEN